MSENDRAESPPFSSPDEAYPPERAEARGVLNRSSSVPYWAPSPMARSDTWHLYLPTKKAQPEGRPIWIGACLARQTQLCKPYPAIDEGCLGSLFWLGWLAQVATLASSPPPSANRLSVAAPTEAPPVGGNLVVAVTPSHT